jgi:hypothetical protein
VIRGVKLGNVISSTWPIEIADMDCEVISNSSFDAVLVPKADSRCRDPLSAIHSAEVSCHDSRNFLASELISHRTDRREVDMRVLRTPANHGASLICCPQL